MSVADRPVDVGTQLDGVVGTGRQKPQAERHEEAATSALSCVAASKDAAMAVPTASTTGSRVKSARPSSDAATGPKNSSLSSWA